MKLVLSLLILFSTMAARAQSISQSEIRAESSKVRPAAKRKSSGFRVGVVATKLDFTSERSENGVIGSDVRERGELGNGYGVSVGYAELPVKQLGYTLGVTVTEVDMKDTPKNLTIGRAEANLALAFSPRAYAKAGLNVSKFLNKDGRDVNADIGTQFGIGVNAVANVGVELNYVTTKQQDQFGPERLALDEQGLEVGVTATF